MLINHTPDQETLLRQTIADHLDRRRTALTETVRVVAAHKGTILHQRACAMAIPMLYAHWEGFAKEALRLYVEFLEHSSVAQRDIHANLLAYSWSGSFRKLQAELTHKRKVEIIERFLGSLTEVLEFEPKERDIDTKSNLFFEVLEGLAQCLCLDIEPMRDHSRSLDALVNRRNHIAHGGREQTLVDSDIEDYRTLVISLMEALERVLDTAVQAASFRRVPLLAASATVPALPDVAPPENQS